MNTSNALTFPDEHATNARRIGNEIWFRRKAAEHEHQPAAAPSRDIWFNVILFACALGLLIVLIFLKAKTVATVTVDPALVAYTSFVTLFQLSRLVTSLMYRRSYKAALEEEAPSASKDLPKISFVIPCMNEENEIKNTISACFAATYPRHLLEVIVINDASTDSTQLKIFEMKDIHPDLVIIDWSENRGKRHGMAEGFRRATGEIVIQLDSDSRIEPTDVPKLAELFRNPKVGAVSFHTDPANADENLVTRLQAAYYFLSFRILKAAESTFRVVFCCSGCASAYRRSVVLPVIDEWLKEKFLGKPVTWGDDRALTNRVIKQGYETMYSDRVRAYTIVPDTFFKFIKQQIRWKKGWLVNSIFAAKFIIKRDPFVAFTYFFPLVLVTTLAPFMAARAFLYTPIAHGYSSTLLYVLGVLAIAGCIAVVYRFYSRSNRYWPYVFFWALFNMFILSYLLLVAIATIQNRSWGTRSVSASRPSAAPVRA
ncbi:MAG TPA: glycosyltransferase [Candidatus Paceibacterota bacterium]|nr:glycosyltransferase [Candidatus Paceibacterota bacterium]